MSNLRLFLGSSMRAKALPGCLVLALAASVGCGAHHGPAQSTIQAPTPLQTSGTASPVPSPAPVCGGPPTMFILLIGSDTRAGDYRAGLADSIKIVRVDFVNPGLSLLTFQRDLYVEIPGISDHAGITRGKLNQAYLYGSPTFGYYHGPGQGPGLLSQSLQQNFGARVDHYVAINMRAFVRAVDALGGLDINLPSTLDGRAEGSRDPDQIFGAGPQHLDGYRTLLLARLRSRGDLQRSETQDLILRALAARILAPDSLRRMPALIEAFYSSVQTDLDATEIARLLCLGSMLDPGKVAALEFPPQLFTPASIHDPVLGYTFAWDVDFDSLRSYVGYFNNGGWPEPTPTLP